MKGSIKYICGIFFISILTSCFTLDSEVDNYSDVYITSKIINNDTMFALGAFSQSNNSLDSVTLIGPDNRKYSLIQFKTFSYFEKEIDSSEYINSVPTIGDYTFTYYYSDNTSAEEIVTLENTLADISTIDSISVDDDYNTITVYWQKANDVDYYSVRIYDEDSAIFLSDLITSDTSAYNISTVSSTWTTYPEDGKTYNLEINSIKLDLYNYTNYINYLCISSSEQVDFVWPK